jgi:hypothetical protein
MPTVGTHCPPWHCPEQHPAPQGCPFATQGFAFGEQTPPTQLLEQQLAFVVHASPLSVHAKPAGAVAEAHAM